MSEPVVTLRDVTFSYNGSVALESISLVVERGDFLVMLGPNGGGKTTLLKCLTGLLHPQQGAVKVFGGSPGEAGGRMGYVPQQSGLGHRFPITVEQVVRMGAPRGKRKDVRRQVLRALERVGMQDQVSVRFDNLSGGQRQRVLVARALAGEPELLVFDEPTANVDPQGKVCIYELLASLGKESTVIVVSHDLVFSASGITAVAAVNKRLVQTRGHTLTPEMLSLIYGVHHHSCPMDDLLQEVSSLFGGGHVHQHEGEEEPRQGEKDLGDRGQGGGRDA